MKHTSLILLLLFFITMQCSRKTNNEIQGTDKKPEIIPIELESMPINDFNSIFELEDYVVLNTTKDNHISDLSKILLTDSKIIILDRVQCCIYFFNRNGDLLKLINDKGRGPKEYSTLDDMFWNDEEKRLTAIDRQGKRMFFYDENGNYLDQKNLDFKPKTFTIDNDSIWFYTGNYGTTYNYDEVNDNHYSLLYTDSDMNLIRMINPIDKRYLGYTFHNSLVSSFAVFDSVIMYGEYYSNVIQSLTNGISQDKFFVDFGNKNIPSKLFAETHPRDLFKKILENGYSYVRGCYALDKYLIIECNTYFVRLDINTHEAIKFSDFETLLGHSIRYLGYDKQNKYTIFKSELYDAYINKSIDIYREVDSLAKSDTYPDILLLYKMID